MHGEAAVHWSSVFKTRYPALRASSEEVLALTASVAMPLTEEEGLVVDSVEPSSGLPSLVLTDLGRQALRT